MAESWHFFGFVVLLIAAFGFVYLASSQPGYDGGFGYFSKSLGGGGTSGGTTGVGFSCSGSSKYSAEFSALFETCSASCSAAQCCSRAGGSYSNPHYNPGGDEDGDCTLNGGTKGTCYKNTLTTPHCVFPLSVTPSPSPTARGPLVTARPSVVVRTTATPSPSGSLNASGCGGNRLCKSVCAQGYSCSGAVSGACGGRCVRSLTASTPRPSIG